MDNGKVSRIRRLIAESTRSDIEQHRNIAPLGAIRRRCLIQEARCLASRYNLNEQLADLVRATGSHTITHLSLDQLVDLVRTIECIGSALDASPFAIHPS